MKLTHSFELVALDDMVAAVPVGESAQQFHGLLRLNETAAAILELLKEETTESQIVEALLKEYEGDPDEIAAYVHEYIEELTKEGFVV